MWFRAAGNDKRPGVHVPGLLPSHRRSDFAEWCLISSICSGLVAVAGNFTSAFAVVDRIVLTVTVVVI